MRRGGTTLEEWLAPSIMASAQPRHYLESSEGGRSGTLHEYAFDLSGHTIIESICMSSTRNARTCIRMG
jgi:hypothetical protein